MKKYISAYNHVHAADKEKQVPSLLTLRNEELQLSIR